MKKLLFTLLALTAIFFACEKEVIDGKNSLMDILDEPISENCPTGGSRIVTGLDLNDNNILEDNEIENSKYICNGSNSIFEVLPEPIGDNCSSGGYKINSGIDVNANNILDSNELLNSEYLCNGGVEGFDKQIRLNIYDQEGVNIYFNYSSSGKIIGMLDHFNKDYWSGIDSVIFVTHIGTGKSSNRISAELYDVTNNSIIENSFVSTNSTTYTKLESQNIFNKLPEGTVNLAIRLKLENSSSSGYIRKKSYLLLYRNNL